MAQQTATPQNPNPRRVSGVVPWIVGALVILGLAVIVALVLFTIFGDEEAEALEIGVTVDEIASQSDQYMNTTVTVSGQINEVISQRAFTIGGDDFFGDSQLLVATSQDVQLPEGTERGADNAIQAGDIIQVTGTVRQFDPENTDAFGDGFGFLFEDDTFSEYEGQPIVTAQSIALTPRITQETARAAVNIQDVLDNSDTYIGNQVSLNGDVFERVNERSFTITDPGAAEDTEITDQRLLVATTGNLPETLVTDARVQVTGTIRRYDPGTLQSRLGNEFGYLFENDVFARYEGEPVLIANSVQVGPQPGSATLEAVIADAGAYVGSNVSVNGEVEQIVDPQKAFSITSDDDQNSAIGGVEVLIVGAPQVFPSQEIPEDAFVTVQGSVQFFNPDSAFEYQGEPIQINPEAEKYEDYGDSLMIVAESIQVTR